MLKGSSSEHQMQVKVVKIMLVLEKIGEKENGQRLRKKD